MGENYRRRIYGRYASQFQGAPSIFDPAAASRLQRAYRYYFRHWLPADKGAAIGELACGGGKMLYALQRWGYRNLSGVDVSPEQVGLARQVLPNVEEGDAIAFLEQRPAHFDLLIAMDLVEHLRKDEILKFLDAAHAALKPGGGLILQTPNAGCPWFGTIRYGDFTHEICFSVNCLNSLLGLAGLAKVEFRETGPVPWGYSLVSTLRAGCWFGIKLLLRFWNAAETGSAGDGIYSRNMLAFCRKQS